MHSADVKKTAATVINRVLEDAAFIFTDDLDEKPAVAQWRATGVELWFAGAAKGRLRMWAGEGFARCAAANMLGVDEDAPDAAQKGLDALKELLNMVVGNLLPELYGQEPVFDLGLPRALAPDRLGADYRNPQAIWVAAEESPVMFVVEIDQE